MIFTDDELQTVFKAVSLVLANAQLTDEGKKRIWVVTEKGIKLF